MRRLSRIETPSVPDEPEQERQQNHRNSIPKLRLFVCPQNAENLLSTWTIIILLRIIISLVCMYSTEILYV